MRYRFDAILLESYHAVYIETPKVACTSIKTALAPLLGVDLKTTQGNPHEAIWPSPTPTSSQSGPLFPGLFAFAFVRNPWDRLVSCYRDKISGEVDGYTSFSIRPGVADCLARFDTFVGGMTFEAFVHAVADIPDEDADEHFRSQTTFVTNEDGQLAIDFVGRYERLADDFRQVEQRTGLPVTQLPQLQATRKQASYTEFYIPETRQVVAERFRGDIEMFGYLFETR